MERLIAKNIELWNQSKRRKPLILMGARQVGKTWLMDEFAKKLYPEDTVSVNLMKSDRLRKRFEDVDLDPKTIIEMISIETGKNIVPGKTLLIIDEIQEAPRALTSLKFFSEDMPELAVMAAGSLLGLAVNRNKKRKNDGGRQVAKASFPVGKVEFLDVPPMTFEEFLLAVGEKKKWEALRDRNWKMIRIFHDNFCDLLKKYYFVGGMPEAVLEFQMQNDFVAVRQVQKAILQAYDADFAKHADGAMLNKIRLLWGSLPSQLSKENKKFIYTALRKGARAREYEAALEWLDDAGMIRVVKNISVPLMPIVGYEEFGSFKLYAHDVGLLGAMANLPQQILLEGSSIFSHFKGALTEQFVAEELSAYGVSPCYWSPDNIKAEIEFIIQHGADVYPIEAKAAINLKAKSLLSYINRFNPTKALRLSMVSRCSGKGIEDYPLYAIREMLEEI